MKFRKKPVEVEATQWFKNGDHPKDYANEVIGLEGGEIRTWTGDEAKALQWEGQIVRYYRTPDMDGQTACKHCGDIMHNHGWIDTLEGGHIVCPGDWIITGVKGEMYPCKDEIFKQTYEPVAKQAASSDAKLWSEVYYGSSMDKGWNIKGPETMIHVGEGEEAERITRAVVAAHNSAIVRSSTSSQKEEPMAWMMKHKTGVDIGLSWSKNDSRFDDMWVRIPLYTKPAQVGDKDK